MLRDRSGVMSGAPVRTCLVLALVLLASGCGFKLRSWELDSSVKAVFIAAADSATAAGSDLGGELRAAFAQSGVTVASARSEADLIVTLLDERRDRRSISVTGAARAAEYELSRSVEYAVAQVADSELQTVIEPRWIRVQRVFRVDRNNIVGSNEEQALVERELKSDIIQQVIRSINLVLTQRAAGAAS